MKAWMLRSATTGALAFAFVAVVGAPAFAADPGAGGGMPIVVTVPTAADEADNISNAQLRWGLNQEAGSGAFAGGCNFLSAGVAGNAGGANVWSASSGLYASRAGAVTILRAENGGWTEASFDTRCLDQNGAPVSVTSLTSATHNQVVIDGGTGRLSATGLHVQWHGSFTVAFYGGMTYWSASDPVLNLDSAGNGTLTAALSGYGTEMADQTKWVPIPARSVVLAQVRGANLGAGGGFSTVPSYLGVGVSGGDQTPRNSQNQAYWGSFPQPFIDFQTLTGQAGYWLTTGGQRDPAKPASELVVNYDAASPAIVPAVGATEDGGSGDPSNPVKFRPDSAAPVLDASTYAPGGTPISVARDDRTGLVPTTRASGLTPLLLPIGGTVLAGLVATLAWLKLAGNLVFPWSRAGR